MSTIVADLIRHIGLDAVHIVGLSLGGLVGLQLAINDPDLVRCLVVVNAYAQMRVKRYARLPAIGRIVLLMFGPMDWLGRWVANGLFPAEEQAYLRDAAAKRIASNQRLAYLQAMLAAARFDLRSRLSEITIPTLIIAGERDVTVPMQAKRELAQKISGAKFVIIHGSGHATPIDAAQHFNRLLLTFLLEADGL
jgi:3-oxoadipate enol-lactonase